MDWNPQQYEKFNSAREAPFHDLVALVRARSRSIARAIDLGCGPGRLTAKLATLWPGATVIGLDSSATMLAHAPSTENVRFVNATIEEFAAGGAVDGAFDVVFSNAALHWVADHDQIVPKLVARLNAGGQLAVQLPVDDYNSARSIFADVAGWRHQMATLDIVEYARILHKAGMEDMTVYEKVYPHMLADADAVLEWAKGTALLPYLERLPPAQHAPFLDEVLRRLRARHPETPVFFPFRRIIFYARRA